MKKIGLISVLFLFFISCEKQENYSAIPEIEFTNFKVSIENTPLGNETIGTLSFAFVDGNGDIGFYENTDSSYHGEPIPDIFIYENYKLNGSYIKADTLKYILPYFQKGEYKKLLKGSIDIRLIHTINDADTVFYEFYIMDRSYNESNIESTPEIIYSEMLQQ